MPSVSASDMILPSGFRTSPSLFTVRTVLEGVGVGRGFTPGELARVLALVRWQGLSPW